MTRKEREKPPEFEPLTELPGGADPETSSRYASAVREIAHDLNNALWAIQFATETELAQRSEGKDPSKDRLEEIRRAIDFSKKLVARLLCVPEVWLLGCSRIDVGELVDGVVGLVRYLLPPGIEVKSAVGSDTGPVLVDSLQIRRVLLNLCLGMAETMVDTGARVELSAKSCVISETLARRDPGAVPGPAIRIDVTDCCTGNTPEQMRRTFSADTATDNNGEGWGLGLAISRGIVADHGGLLAVESDLEKGSRISVYLPASRTTQRP